MDFAKAATDLRSPTFLVRELAAAELARAGVDGALALAQVALDARCDESVRVTAVRHFAAAHGDDLCDALRILLGDPSPAIRLWAIAKVADAKLVSLVDLVTKLTTDETVVWDLDEERSVAKAATEALARLGK